MKLLSLAMTAFGPYAATEEIDFRTLGDRSFVLICGPTGAGKSSILDGICFALYGETSGRDRDPGRMRSDFADDRTETSVTLEFALRHRIYRVTRQPKQVRRALRGADRMVEMQAKATLERIDADGTCVKALGEAVREVDERVASLLGFDAEQFRQIVMLPQGKFQKLLLCPSGDREKIFEVLFGTEFYRRVQERLREDAARLKREWEDGDSRRQTMLQQAGVDSSAALVEQLGTLVQKTRELAAALVKLREASRRQQEELQAAGKVVEKLDELESARAALEALAGQETEIASKQDILRAAQAAAGLADVEAITLQKERDADTARKSLKAMQTACGEAETAAGRAKAALAAENEKEGERKALADQLKELAAAVPRFEALEKALADFAQSDREWRRMIDEQELLDKKVIAQQRLITGTAEEIEKSRTEAGDLRFLAGEAGRLEKLLGEREKLDAAQQELRKAEKRAAGAARDARAVEKRLESARKQLDQVEARWVAGQASRLSASLAEGEPCPVCGSTEHPKPAKARCAIVVDSELDEARGDLQKLDKQAKSAQKAVASAEREEERLKTRVEGLETTLGDYAKGKVSALQSDLQQALSRRDAAQQASGRVGQLQENLKDAKEQLAELDKALRKARKETDDLRERRTQSETQAAERKRALPEGIGDRKTLDRRADAARKTLAGLVEALEKAKTADEQARKKLVESQTALRGQGAQTGRALKEKAEAADRFAARVKAAGFDSVADYSAAKRDAKAMKALENEIREFETSRTKAKGRLDRAVDAARSLVRPDVAALQSKIDGTLKDLEVAIAEERSTRDRMDALTKLQADLAGLTEELVRVEGRYNVTSGLSELARGRNTRRSTLQQFVLMTILDGVLHTANRRYGPMTRGRYQLLRVDAENEGKGGLDLAVHDSHTNQPRLASTLSGGEVFQASLALALGLADEVMARAGGIQLDTTFVDEGFGSLDSESLDLAVRWLLDLREAGRMVGIISHVPELRDRIETRLEVIPSPTGSTTKFVV